ncbi:MAG: stage V sporulation protein AB [Firmicutes bacterium]|nr:stage V sporulation protein AB [Bacillota bacterium]
MMIIKLILILIGLSGGILVGTALASFITLLDIVPRLAQVSDTSFLIPFYQLVMTLSIVVVTLSHFFEYSLHLTKYITMPIGLIIGVFVGLLAAALAEVLNVIPILERRTKLGKKIYYCLLGISLGKVFGSLFYWLKM